jgi:hypothetical protein
VNAGYPANERRWYKHELATLDARQRQSSTRIEPELIDITVPPGVRKSKGVFMSERL